MRKLPVLVALVAGLATALTIAPAASAAQPSTGINIPLPIVGQQCTITQGTTTVTGTVTSATLTITNFVASGGQLLAEGTATVTCTAGALSQTATQTFSLAAGTAIPVTGGSGSCQILHLELGPLDLDLLGLKVHLDKVVLDITAQSGPGNLLGNLLCGLANALNAGAP